MKSKKSKLSASAVLEFANGALKGDKLSISRLMSLVESGDDDTAPAMNLLHKHTGKAKVVGITGVAGGGKSTIVCGLTRELRKKGRRVGIIAVDPTSPFTGGALLGDRVRMTELSSDDGVFIRSMRTHGAVGGLTNAIYEIVWILDSAGFDIIIVETVGIGQDEVDIVKIADTTTVVTVPGLGDSVQTIKAGIMEIGDILVVNKSDRPGADQTVEELRSMIELGGSKSGKSPAIIKTTATKRDGIEELTCAIDDHLKFLGQKIGQAELHRRRCKNAVIEGVKKRVT